MELPPEAIQEFKLIYQETTGVALSDAEALETALNLLSLLDAVYQPIPKGRIGKLQDQFPELSSAVKKKE